MTARGLLLVLVVATGCTSHYSHGTHPKTFPAPEGTGVVYVYRPARAFGALTTIVADVYGRKVDLFANSYAAFVVPAGRHVVHARIEVVASSQMVDGFGQTGTITTAERSDFDTPIELDVQAGETYFIRTEFDSRSTPPTAALVGEKEGRDEVGDVYPVPGGRARWPVPGPAQP